VSRFGAVAALTVLALVLGFWGALRTPLDVFPEFVPSEVEIQTEAPGFSPQQVEELVTKPVENAVNGASGLATLRSESIPGLSVVDITFADGIDVHVARQGISERLSELGSGLPTGVGAPKLSPLVSSTMDLAQDRPGVRQGRRLCPARRGRLGDQAASAGRTRGGSIIVFGGRVRQIQIQPDMQRLTSFGLTLNDVADAARAALPLRGAGFIDIGQPARVDPITAARAGYRHPG
jgi:Cu/Ag efflux pump CusA